MALKRAGRGQDPLGVEATAQGELAVECPACPHPGRNLPDNWREAGKMLYVEMQLLNHHDISNLTSRFLYILYIAVDANFKLKGKDRGLKDVELMPGWAYFVREEEFQAHIANHTDEPEVFFFLGSGPHKLDAQRSTTRSTVANRNTTPSFGQDIGPPLGMPSQVRALPYVLGMFLFVKME
jgi:hypothetical protein